MLQSLSEFFVLISKDKKAITCQDLSTFYYFIIKKMPQIEQQYPSLISNSLEESSILSSSTNDKRNKNIKDSKESKKLFAYFQKQIMNLYNELIDYCYYEKIIKITSKCEQIIKEKIMEKIHNNENKNILDININYGNIYLKEISLKKIIKEEIRNYIIFLIVNKEINFNITPHNFVNFFNIENKKKLRDSALLFVKFAKSFSGVYKIDKKTTKMKKTKKITNIQCSNINSNSNNTGSIIINNNASNNNTNKTNKNTNNLNKNNIKEVKTNNYIKKEKHKNYYQKISNKRFINDYKILKKNKYSTEKKDSNRKESEELNDTLKCQTPKNISFDDKKKNQIEINSGGISKIYLTKLSQDSYHLRRGRKSEIKQLGNISSRCTVSSISYKKNKKSLYFEIDKNKNVYKSLKRYSYAKGKKKETNQENKDIKHNKDLEETNSKISIGLLNSILKDNKSKNLKTEDNKTEENICINKESSKILEKIKTVENINDTQNRKFRLKNKLEHITDDFTDISQNNGYNIVNTFGINKKNVKFKESYLFKNSEVHQHMVIYNDEAEKDSNTNNEEDSIGCNII